LDERTARAIRLALEAEAAFGATDYPRTARAWEGAATAPGASAPGPELVSAQAPAAPPDAAAVLAAIAAEIAACTACKLCGTRTRTVPGQGDARARLLFVGEAPGETEDRTGLAFVGAAGQLLTRMIQAMGLEREQVFIANVLKCRPPANRPPEPDEVASCASFLERQIAALDPDVICTLGGHASKALLRTTEPISRLRGRAYPYGRAQLVPTFHPSYLLKTPEKKKDAWQDLQLAMRLLPPR
jgi:uracil-DNA glycosylase